MIAFISYLIILFIGHMISEYDDDAQWKDEAYQKNRAANARRMGYDLTAKSKREKYHGKYGYTYDSDMKNKPYDITFAEWKANKEGEEEEM